MLLSLSVDQKEGECSKCGGQTSGALHFLLITEDYMGETTGLCIACAVAGCSIDVAMAPLADKPSKRKSFKKAKKVSLKQEVEVCELLGARTQPGSGNQAGAKGDGRKRGELRIEAKFTKAESYSLKLDELQKIQGEASPGEIPLFVIDYNEPGTSRLRGRYAVLPFTDAVELVELRREKYAAGKHR